MFRLTEAIKKFILKTESRIKCNSEIIDIRSKFNNKQYCISIHGNNPNILEKILVKNIVFTTSSKVANYLLIKFNF